MATKKATSPKYGPKAHQSVEREMKAMEAGTLRSGSGEKVTNPKQAIAIGLSEARRAGGKVPPPPAEKVAGKKVSANRPAKKAAAKKVAAKRSPAKKTVDRKAPARKRTA